MRSGGFQPAKMADLSQNVFACHGYAIAFVVKAGVLLIARNGVTVRPLNESSLRLKTKSPIVNVVGVSVGVKGKWRTLSEQ